MKALHLFALLFLQQRHTLAEQLARIRSVILGTLQGYRGHGLRSGLAEVLVVDVLACIHHSLERAGLAYLLKDIRLLVSAHGVFHSVAQFD